MKFYVSALVGVIKYNFMFRRLAMAIFRLYMKYLVSSYMGLVWAVYSGKVGVEVGTRSRMCHGGCEMWVHIIAETPCTHTSQPP